MVKRCSSEQFGVNINWVALHACNILGIRHHLSQLYVDDDLPRLIQPPFLLEIVKFIPLLFVLGLGGCSYFAQAKPNHWEWYPTLNLKAELDLNKDIMTFRMTNTGQSDQTVLDGLFDEEFLKEEINVQIGGYNPLHGQSPPTYKLSGDGLLGPDDKLVTIKSKIIHPAQTVEVAFDIIKAMHEVHNAKLEEALNKDPFYYSIIFPIPPYFVDKQQAGTIQFITPYVLYKSH